MNTQKNRLPRLILSIASLVASVAGLLMIGLLNVLTDGTNQFSFGMYLNDTIALLSNTAAADPNLITSYMIKAIISYMIIFGFVWALVLIIVSIVNIVKSSKDGNGLGAAINTAKLSSVPLVLFGLITFFAYFNDGTDSLVPTLGLYIALGLGALGACLAVANYFLSSEKPMLSKILRSCLLVVGYAAAVFALMPTIVVGGTTFAPGTLFIIRLSSLMGGGGSLGSTFYMSAALLVALIVVALFVNMAGSNAIDERVNKFRKSPANSAVSIITAALAVVLVVGALIVVPLMDPTKSITVNMYAYIAIALAGLTLILVIVSYILSKKEKPQEKPQVEPVVNEVVGEEPEEEPVPVEETPAEEEAVVAPVANEEVNEPAPVEEAQEEPKVQEEAAPQEEESEPAPVEEAPVEEEKPAEKAEPKKKAPAKKPAEKKEAAPAKKAAPKKEEPKAEPKKKAAPAPKEEPKAESTSKKNTASYHLSKRASDNKWQVFRAGSDKVIKLFDTKVEAEEYTKRMAENQGVSYLSHASKGKNKGRIQKK